MPPAEPPPPSEPAEAGLSFASEAVQPLFTSEPLSLKDSAEENPLPAVPLPSPEPPPPSEPVGTTVAREPVSLKDWVEESHPPALPLTPPPPRKKKAPFAPAAPPPSKPVEAPVPGEVNLKDWAEEAIASSQSARPASTPDEDEVIPFRPFEDEEPAAVIPEEPIAVLPEEPIGVLPEPPSWEPPPSRVRPSIRALADDIDAPGPTDRGQPPPSHDELPLIPMKRLYEREEPRARPVREPVRDAYENDRVVEGTPWRDHLENTVRWLVTTGEAVFVQLVHAAVFVARQLVPAGRAVLSQLIDLARRLCAYLSSRLRQAREQASTSTRKPSARVDELPSTVLQPLEEEKRAPSAPKLQELRSSASPQPRSFTGWVDDSTHQDRPPGPPPPAESLAWPAAVSSGDTPDSGPSTRLPSGIGVLADEPSTIRLRPLEDESAAAAPGLQQIRNLVSTGVGVATGWVEGLARLVRRPPGDPRAAPSALPRETLQPPPPVSELPVLRLAKSYEPKVAEEVYEGESLFPAVWPWLKRVVVMTCLLAGGILAALNWEKWSPEAGRVSKVVFNETTDYMRSVDETQRYERALQESIAQLPQLSRETIELVLSKSAATVSDPPEVFRLAYEAEARGLSALTSEEAVELEALRGELLDTLGPWERDRIDDYDRARAYRITLPFEDRGVLELLARGARALPPPSLERMQVLSGKAVAAGLAHRARVAPRPPAER